MTGKESLEDRQSPGGESCLKDQKTCGKIAQLFGGLLFQVVQDRPIFFCLSPKKFQ